MSPQRKAFVFIVVFSVSLVLVYDFAQIWRNRAKACDLSLQNCSADFVCASVKRGGPGRCLPRASAPSFVLDLPFASGAPVQCLRGSRDSSFHSTDFDAFAIDLRVQVPNGARLNDLQQKAVVAAGDGTAFVFKGCAKDQSDSANPCRSEWGNHIMILHADGYVSLYAHLESLDIKPGPVRSGEIIGTVGTSGENENDGKASLHFSVHYLNPVMAKDLLEKSEHPGLSVPFQLRVRQSADRAKPIETVMAHELNCSADSDLRLFRADAPL